MAGGWARDGAEQEQIEASSADELARMKARKSPVGESLTHSPNVTSRPPKPAAWLSPV